MIDKKNNKHIHTHLQLPSDTRRTRHLDRRKRCSAQSPRVHIAREDSNITARWVRYRDIVFAVEGDE